MKSLFYFMAMLCISACRQPSAKGVSGSGRHGKADIRYAHGFSIDHYDHYKLVTVFNPRTTTTDSLKYLLVPEGYPVPAGYPGVQVIHTPVRTIVAMWSADIALASFAGVADRITGLGNLAYASSPEVIKNIKNGKVTQVGIDAGMNEELILTMHPGILMATGDLNAGFDRYKTLIDAGVPVLPDLVWLESTPLGRAEWVKLTGALVEKEDMVDKKFDSIARAYNDLAQIGRRAPRKPRVIVDMPFKGSWFVPAGESYLAELLKDAGAGYKWSDTHGTGSLALNFEAVAPEALTSEYWLNVGFVDSKKEIAAKDSRYTGFRSFRMDHVYNNNKITNDQGANDYWESGIVNPQLVLADMIRILHPGLLPDRQLVYYKQLK